MDYKEILGLDDIDAEEMVLVVGGGLKWVVNPGSDHAVVLENVAEDNAGLAAAMAAGAPFALAFFS
jgi:hypothetical protein